MVCWREDLKIGTGYLESWVYHVVQSVEIEYFISFSRILRHNVHFGHTGELSQLANIIVDILSQLQTLYKKHSVKERGWLFLRHSAWLS